LTVALPGISSALSHLFSDAISHLLALTTLMFSVANTFEILLFHGLTCAQIAGHG
jgi:hypothetical protein